MNLNSKKFIKQLMIWVSVIITITGFIIALSVNNDKSIEPKKEILPEPIRISENTTRFHSIGYVDHNISGIHYRIFISSGYGAMSIINVTKDSLEVIKLQKK